MSILDTIDGALADYAASSDAMRWVPEGERDEWKRPSPIFRGVSLDGTTWLPVSFDHTPLLPPLDIGAITRGLDQFAAGIRGFFEDLGIALAPLMRVLGTIAVADAEHEQRRRGGGKLAVNGREYQRRLRARRRRNR